MPSSQIDSPKRLNCRDIRGENVGGAYAEVKQLLLQNGPQAGSEVPPKVRLLKALSQVLESGLGIGYWMNETGFLSLAFLLAQTSGLGTDE